MWPSFLRRGVFSWGFRLLVMSRAAVGVVRVARTRRMICSRRDVDGSNRAEEKGMGWNGVNAGCD